MKKYLILGFLLLALVATPLAAKADTESTVADLQAQIAALMAQIAALTGDNSQNCFTFTSDLYMRISGHEKEIARLSNVLVKEGILAEEFMGYGTFDEKIAAAVVQFQRKHGILQTGYVGPLTRAALNSLYGCQQTGKPVITGVSGPTSLNVGQTGTWTVSARDPNNGTLSYSVDWGNFQEKMGQTQTATFSHSYSVAETYRVTFYVTNSSGQTVGASISVNAGNVSTVTESAEVAERLVFDACSSGETAKGNLSHNGRPVYLCAKTQTIRPETQVITASKISFNACADGYTASSYVSNFDGRNQTLYHCVKKAVAADNQTVVLDSKLSPACPSGYTETSWFNDSGVRAAHCVKTGTLDLPAYGGEDEDEDGSSAPNITEASSKGASKNEIYLGEDVMVTGSNLTGLTTANIGNRTIALTDNNGTYAFFTAPSESVLRPGSYNFKLSSKSGATNSFKVTVKRLGNTTPQIVEVIEHFVSGACPSSEVAKGNLMNGDTPIYLCARTQTVVEGMHVIAASRIRFDNCSSAGYVGSSHVSDFDNRNRTLYHCIQSSAAQSGDTAVVDSLLAQTCPSGYTETSWFNDSGVRVAHCVKTQTLNFGVPSM